MSAVLACPEGGGGIPAGEPAGESPAPSGPPFAAADRPTMPPPAVLRSVVLYGIYGSGFLNTSSRLEALEEGKSTFSKPEESENFPVLGKNTFSPNPKNRKFLKISRYVPGKTAVEIQVTAATRVWTRASLARSRVITPASWPFSEVGSSFKIFCYNFEKKMLAEKQPTYRKECFKTLHLWYKKHFVLKNI